MTSAPTPPLDPVDLTRLPLADRFDIARQLVSHARAERAAGRSLGRLTVGDLRVTRAPDARWRLSLGSSSLPAGSCDLGPLLTDLVLGGMPSPAPDSPLGALRVELDRAPLDLARVEAALVRLGAPGGEETLPYAAGRAAPARPGPVGGRSASDDDALTTLDGPEEGLGAPLPSSRAGRRRAAAGKLSRFAVGDWLGPYEITGHLGSGGMGEVLQVVDPELGRSMAAKVVLAGGARAALNKFVLEAQVTGQLEHPNIIPVYQLGRTPDACPYFTMKQVHGRDLSDLIDELKQAESDGAQRPEQSLARLLPVFVKICDGIAFAHSRGVIHRDLKPANVMVGEFGEVLVMDWGLAKLLGRDEERSAEDAGTASSLRLPTPAPELTIDGKVLGTPAFMPPEQASGLVSELDARSDVYSLGAVLYCLLTFQMPYDPDRRRGFDSDDAVDERMATPSERCPLRPIPWELEAVVLRAMARHPRDRYPEAALLGADVARFLEGQTLHAVRYTPLQRVLKWLRRHRTAAAVALVGVLIGLGLVSLSRWQRQRALVAELDAISGQLASHDVGALLGGAESRARPTGPARGRESLQWRARREQLVRVHLDLVSRIDRVLSALPGHPRGHALRRDAGRRLGRLALAGGDYTLARWSFDGLRAHGASDAQTQVWRTRVAEAESAQRRHRKQRLELMLADLKQGLSRPGRTSRALLEDYVLEALAYRDQQTVTLLAQALEPLVREGAAAVDRTPPGSVDWTQQQRGLARFVTGVLGRLGLREAVRPLGRWALACGDRALRLEAGLALCRTGRVEAYDWLMKLRERVGVENPVWTQIAQQMQDVPEPAGRTMDLETLEARALVRVQRGDLDGAITGFTQLLDRDPKRASAYVNRANTYLRRGDLERATDDIARAIELEPRHPTAYVIRASLRQHQGDGDGALADYGTAIALQPQTAVHYLHRANLLDGAGRPDEALIDLDRAIALEPRLLLGWTARGWLRYHTRRDLPGAIADANSALRLDPRCAEAYVLRGSVLNERGDHDGALADLDRAIELTPSSWLAFINRGIVHRARNQPRAAIPDFDQAMRLDPKRRAPWVYGHRGHARLESGDASGAAADFKRAIELDPDDLEWRVMRGQALLAAGQMDPAQADLDHVLARRPRDPSALLLRAELRRQRGDLKGALADLDACIALPSASSAAHYNRGLVRRATGDLDGALADFDRAIELSPRSPGLHYTRAGLRSRRGDTPGALADYDRVLELDPRHARARTNRARLHYIADRNDDALADVRIALRHDPKVWQAWYILGAVLRDRKDRAGALEAFGKALPLAPTAQREQVREQIKALSETQ